MNAPEKRSNTPAVGRSVRRQDGEDKVTGQAAFLDDLSLNGLLHTAVLRSPHAHAAILSLDDRAARDVDGVWTVVTGDHVPALIGECIRDHSALARGKVRHVGEPVAVVVARDAQAAARGVEALQVEYEPLPAVLDVDEAQAADAPLIHEDLADYHVLPSYHPRPGTNVYHCYSTARGDADAVLDAEEHVFEGVYEFPHISHVQLEPHGAVALWRSPTELTVWCSAQSPHLVRHVLAGMFDLPMTGVQVIVPYIGGGFGGKSDTTVEPLAALAARQVVGRPVRLVLSREEMFFGSVLGRGCRARIRTAHDDQGHILAQTSELSFACGAFGEYGINVVEGAGHVALGPYRVPTYRVESRAVYVNTPFTGAFRGYGHPEVHWAVERHMDRVAQALDLDPTELRRRNLLRAGDRHATGQRVEVHHGDLAGCMEVVSRELRSEELTTDDPERVRGVAVSPLMKAPVMATNASSAAVLKLNPDATVDLLVSGTEMGQGSWTALTQIAADALGFPAGAIRTARQVDTTSSPYEWQTVGSTTTWKVGQAVRAAAADLLHKLKRNASLRLHVPAERLDHDGRELWDREDPDTRVLVRRVALNALHPDGTAEGGPVAGYGTFTPHGITFPDPETGTGDLAGEWTFGCQGALVEVDTGTGETRVIRLITAMDVGRVVNPVLARGQVVGAMVQGLGTALLEGVVYGEDGTLRNAGLTDYKIPTIEDLQGTRLDVRFLETPFPDGPFGARCIGEHGLVSVAPVLGNAIRAATGCNLDRLPLNADTVLAALVAGGEGS